MSILVLSESDVRGVLDMPSCIDAMELTLAGLQRGELSMPLRFVVRPPTADANLFGLMPAHRGGDDSLYSLKEIVVTPGNSAHGIDPHQGSVLLHDGTTGRLRRSRQRLGDHRDQDRGRVGASRRGCSLGRTRGRSRSSDPGCRALARRRDACGDPGRDVHDLEPDSGPRRRARERDGCRDRAEPSRRRSPLPTSSAPPPRHASRSCDGSGSRLART